MFGQNPRTEADKIFGDPHLTSLVTMHAPSVQGDHFRDNVKFPDGSRHSSAALGMLSVTHIMPVLVLLSVVGVGMQQCMI